MVSFYGMKHLAQRYLQECYVGLKAVVGSVPRLRLFFSACFSEVKPPTAPPAACARSLATYQLVHLSAQLSVTFYLMLRAPCTSQMFHLQRYVTALHSTLCTPVARHPFLRRRMSARHHQRTHSCCTCSELLWRASPKIARGCASLLRRQEERVGGWLK